MGTLYSLAVPIYDSKVLKSRFEEAKTGIQAIALAQERYRIETGVYYPSGIVNDEVEISNGNVIASNLLVDLSQSTNFIYTIEVEDDDYTIRAILRDSDWDESKCDNAQDSTKTCTQSTLERDDWVAGYTTGFNNHFIRFSYPTMIVLGTGVTSVDNGIDYTHINTGGTK